MNKNVAAILVLWLASVFVVPFDVVIILSAIVVYPLLLVAMVHAMATQKPN